MIDRLIKVPKGSFFLFGPRGTGKTTFLKNAFAGEKYILLDLINPNEEDVFNRDPHELEHRLKSRPDVKTVIIDEVQKAPRLLDLAHKWIEERQYRFILTGSSARKLKRGGANLLAGRAFVLHMHPFTHLELGKSFDLEKTLHWGSLPKLTQLKTNRERTQFLQAYALTYLKEEIAVEQLVRRLAPFRRFLEIAAQMNGQVLNFSKIADDVGVDTVTVQNYYSILEDTLTGFFLQAHHTSVRKSLRFAPKFYLFDTGVKRALDHTLTIPLSARTYGYGAAFEHFIITEFHRLNDYLEKDWTFSFLRTKDQMEVDLIINRPGLPTAWLEIKSADHINERDTSSLNRLAKDFPRDEFYCLSQDPHSKKIQSVDCFFWREGFERIFNLKAV